MLLSNYKKISITFNVNTSNPRPEREEENNPYTFNYTAQTCL